MQEREQGQVIPFWFLNDKLKNETLSFQLERIKQVGVNGVILHARYGLPKGFYLSREWFSTVAHILDEASRLGLDTWIYDDFNWPSGTAGGKLTHSHTSLQEKVLVCKGGNLQISRSSFEIAYQHSRYIDPLGKNTGVAFINATHDRYKEYFGRHLGTTIRGFFTDEPGFHAGLFGFVDRGAIPFTEDLLSEFKSRRGYDPQGELSYIWNEFGSRSRKIRLDYWQTVSELYQERFLGSIQRWCHENGVLSMGHLLEEEDPLNLIKSQGNPFTALSCFDWVGYDLISSLKQIHTVSAALADSTARIYHKPNVVAETMGGFGWEMKPEMMIELAGWHARKGANILIPHALFYSTRDDRRFDSPPSLFEEPYWSSFPSMVNRFLQEQKADRGSDPLKIAIYFPVKTLWATYNPNDESRARGISETIKAVSLLAEAKSRSFTYLNDEALKELDLNLSKEVIIPKAEVMPLGSLRALARFLSSGGKLAFINSFPQFADNEHDQNEFERTMQEIRESPNMQFVSLPVEASYINTILQGIQYRVWQELACISPRYAALLIQIKHLLLKA